MMKLKLSLLLAVLVFATVVAEAASWRSTLLGKDLTCTVSKPSTQAKDAAGKSMVVVYLENLPVEMNSTVSNADNVKWLNNEGYTVIRVDYARNAMAVSPAINKDIIAINDALGSGAFAGVSNISTIRAYVVPEGWRIKRDVVYAKDDSKVYNLPDGYDGGDNLYMDIVYPAQPRQAVPTLLSFSYSNSWHGKEHQRMYLGYTLSMFDDAIQEGAPLAGMAWAICDHPKYCDWGNGKYTGGANKSLASIEVCPDAYDKVNAAVDVLRAEASALGLSDKVGVYGFSRGSTAASLLIGGGKIQAAILGPGVFDYQKMATGSREYTNMKAYVDAMCKGSWQGQGGAWYVKDGACPTFMFYNTDDDANYKTQADNLISIFKAKGVTYDTMVNYGSGHSVPQKEDDVKRIYEFLLKNLAEESTGIDALQMCPGKCSAQVYSLNGQLVARNLSEAAGLGSGIYISGGRKFLK